MGDPERVTMKGTWIRFSILPQRHVRTRGQASRTLTWSRRHRGHVNGQAWSSRTILRARQWQLRVCQVPGDEVNGLKIEVGAAMVDEPGHISLASRVDRPNGRRSRPLPHIEQVEEPRCMVQLPKQRLSTRSRVGEYVKPPCCVRHPLEKDPMHPL